MNWKKVTFNYRCLNKRMVCLCIGILILSIGLIVGGSLFFNNYFSGVNDRPNWRFWLWITIFFAPFILYSFYKIFYWEWWSLWLIPLVFLGFSTFIAENVYPPYQIWVGTIFIMLALAGLDLILYFVYNENIWYYILVRSNKEWGYCTYIPKDDMCVEIMTIVADEHTERVFPCYLPTQLYCPNGKSNKKKPKHNMNTHKTAKAKTTNKMQNKKSNNPSKQMPKLNKILFKDIAGLDSVKKAFDDKVIFPLKNKKMFKKYKMKSGGGILLYGLPGTGKTMFAQAAANEVDAKFISIKCSDIMSQWYGESEKKIKDVFLQARKSPVSIIFFDEFDALGRKRSTENVGATTINEILAQMQGFDTSANNTLLLVIAATNCPWDLDSALLRPGRFDDKIYVDLPDMESKIFIINSELKDMPLSKGISVKDIAKKMHNYNAADIVEFVHKLKIAALKRSIKEKSKEIISLNDVEDTFKTCASSVKKEDIESMNNFRKNN